jgi:hypothetical protein
MATVQSNSCFLVARSVLLGTLKNIFDKYLLFYRKSIRQETDRGKEKSKSKVKVTKGIFSLHALSKDLLGAVGCVV